MFIDQNTLREVQLQFQSTERDSTYNDLSNPSIKENKDFSKLEEESKKTSNNIWQLY